VPRQPAIVYIPAGLDAGDWSREAQSYADHRDYVVRHLVRHWREVQALMRINDQLVVLVSTRGHLPPDRLPRLEIVDEQEDRPAAPGQRRPRRAADW
jgi:hypothetical protein